MDERIIFVNGFQRGGTNILVNLLASHPATHWVTETHMVFYGMQDASFANKWARRFLYLPVLLGTRQHYFWLNRIGERKPLPPTLSRYVDLLLTNEANRSIQNKYFNENLERHDIHPNQHIRPIFKNMNGVILTTEMFSKLYPEATFIGLVRDGLALCEGFLRRGWTVERFGKMYARVCGQMIEDAARLPCYKILRFEDILADSATAVRQAYAWAGLELWDGMKFRLQSKKSMGKDGRRSYTFGNGNDRETHWFLLEELPNFLRKDVNENQKSQLSERDRNICLEYIHEPMTHFGYL